MRVLVTGGTGVVGDAAVSELVRRGHEVRLLSRHATREARRWPAGVEPWTGDVGDPRGVAGSAEGVDAVLHLAGIVAEAPPTQTFENVNVEGTRRIVAEAERAGAPRLVFVSSLGAERGRSDYHRSKRAAERVVRGFRAAWTILRPGSVYGPGDQTLEVLLRLVRTWPVLPLVDGGEDRFQPLWHEDLARAIALALERDDLAGRALELAGTEVVTLADAARRLSEISGRAPITLPVPGAVAEMAARAADALGLPLPVASDTLTMLREGNVVAPGRVNALTAVLGIEPLPFAEGLRRLAERLPERTPARGVGPLVHKRYTADVVGSTLRPEQLKERFRRSFRDVLPVAPAPATHPPVRLRKGTTVTLRLALRGVVQMRVADVRPDRVTFITVEGHPLAGAVSVVFTQAGRALRVVVEVWARAAGLLDLALMRTVGGPLQDLNWTGVVLGLVAESGGRAPAGVIRSTETLRGDEARAVSSWVSDLVLRHRREERAALRPTGRRRRAGAAGTGNARRSRSGTGSARTSGRGGRPGGASRAPRTATR